VGVKSDGTVIVEEQGRRSFVNPHRPIPPQSSGVHRIIDKDVESAPDLDEACKTATTHGFRASFKSWSCG
jgi:DNA polymerase III epsilon subunit-like protein